MDIDSFRNIVGEARQGAPALIRFFGKITESSTAQFNAEFEYLNNIVKPSLIRVLINSEGGSVLYGMTSLHNPEFIGSDRVYRRGHGRIDGVGHLGCRG